VNKTVIVDLDGTLADINHRVPLVKQEKPDWDAFYDACKYDALNQWCADLMDAMADTHNVIILSGRSKRCLKDTRDWLKKNNVSYHKLVLVREERDYTPDQDLKRDWMRKFTGRRNVAFIVDDRTRVVEMWRAEGYVCLQCARWEEWKPIKKA